MNAFIVAFSGHSGAGKSTLIKRLVSLISDVNVLRIDDYDGSSYPSTEEWIEGGADPNAFQTPQFFSDILALKNGKPIMHPDTNQQITPARLLFIEEPFGRGRDAISGLIGLSVYVDTPLEVALARKVLRLGNLISQGNSDISIAEHLQWYLSEGRSFYMAVERSARKNCDLVLDGLLSADEMVKITNEAINKNLKN